METYKQKKENGNHNTLVWNTRQLQNNDTS